MAALNRKYIESHIAKERKNLQILHFLLGLVSVTVRSAENRQISPELRQSIKDVLMIRRGKCTEYDIDDLLNDKWLKISSSDTENLYLRYANRQLLEERVPKNQLI